MNERVFGRIRRQIKPPVTLTGHNPKRPSMHISSPVRVLKLSPQHLTAGLILILFSLPVIAASAADDGVWVGGTDLLGSFSLVELDLHPTPSAPPGTVEIRPTNTGPLPIRTLGVADGAMDFELPTPRGVLTFSGKLQGDRLEGTAIDEFGQKKNGLLR